MTQEKMVCTAGQNERIHWEIDTKAIRDCVPWAKSNRRRLEREVQEMDDCFPYFVATLARNSKLELCSNCRDILVWRDGLECLSCDSCYNAPRDAQLAFRGQIPSIIGKVDERGKPIRDQCRPIFRKLIRELEEGRGSNALGRYLNTTGNGDYYFTPLVTCYLPSNWPKHAPKIILEKEYFEILGLKADHVFPDRTGGGYQLCNYANWPNVTLRVSLQQRIVPRIIIDLMLSSLTCIGKLDRVLSNLGTSLHNVYNWIGKPRKSQLFQEQYNRYVRL